MGRILDHALEIIASATDDLKWIGSPVFNGAIAKAESDMGMKIPPDLAAFIARFGYGGVEGCAIYGISGARSSDEFRYPDIVSKNLSLRKHGVPETLLVFEDVGDGQVYALDLSVSHTDPPVVAFLPAEAGDARQLDFVSDSFAEHLLSEMITALQERGPDDA